MKKPNSILSQFIQWFTHFEKILALIISLIILVIVFSALYRVVISTYELVVLNIFNPVSSDFKQYTTVFAKILTLLISIEFMNTIVKIAKGSQIRVLLVDVIIITGLAICRKLIIMDYKEYEPLYIFAFAGVLIALGCFVSFCWK